VVVGGGGGQLHSELLCYFTSAAFRVALGYTLSRALALAAPPPSAAAAHSRPLRVAALQLLSAALQALAAHPSASKVMVKRDTPSAAASASASASASAASSKAKGAGEAEQCIEGEAGAVVAASFLPGIVSALCGVVRGDPKDGSRVVCAAVRALTQTLTLVLNDQTLTRYLRFACFGPFQCICVCLFCVKIK
jgi:hypothetical protein